MRSLLKLSRVTYSPNTTTNKKPALGGLEKAQALRSLLIPTRDSSPAMMPSSHSGLVGTGVETTAPQAIEVAVMKMSPPLSKSCGQPAVP